MSLINSSNDMTPFDLRERPVRQFLPISMLLWTVSYISTGGPKMKIRKIRMRGLKGPYLVLATHQGPMDYYIVPRLLFPRRANYVSDMEGFANYGKWLYRHGGCIGKRRYTPSVEALLNMKYVLEELREPLVIFPESRHCDAGVTSQFPDNLGALAKYLKVPVVTVTAHGGYLSNPFWDESRTRKVPLSATIEQIFTAEELENASANEVQAAIAARLQYDEYEWQRKNKIRISEPWRAEGLHLPLYQCPKCRTEGRMQSYRNGIFCESCGVYWEMDEFGSLTDHSDSRTVRIPDWYRWERRNVRRQLTANKYQGIDVPVRVEALPNEKGFVELGNGRLRHDAEGYTLSLDDMERASVRALRDVFPLRIPNSRLESTQTEYNYHGKGKCIVLSTANCCYYVYSDAPEFLVTKLEFAVEESHKSRKCTE